VVAETALSQGSYSRIAFLDDSIYQTGSQPSVLGWPVLGPLCFSMEAESHATFGSAFVGIGNPLVRLFWLNKLMRRGYEIPRLIHPKAWVSPSSSIGIGSVIFAQATLQSQASIGRGSILNTSCSVDHDCRLADGVHIGPGARLAGGVYVGSRSWIGIGSSVVQGVRIGLDVTIGAGAAVVHDIADGLTAYGVPARPR